MKKLSTNQQLLVAIVSAVPLAYLYLYLKLEIGLLERILDQGGSLFIQTLQMFAIPLVLFSVILGVSSMENAKRLKRVALYSTLIYTITTLFSVFIGVCLGLLLKPGLFFRRAVKGIDSIIDGGESAETGIKATNIGVNNLFQLLADNNNLVFVLLFALVVALAVLQLPSKKKQFMLTFCETMNEIFLKIISWVIRLAPLGVFCILTSQIITFGKENTEDVMGMISGLAVYSGVVILGLLLMLFVVYPVSVMLLTKTTYGKFVKTMYPAQLFAFSTASSTASLAKTSEQVGKMGVPKRIRSFVLGLGATVNMDGTALYQGVLAVFVMQVFNIEMTFWAQCYIIGYVTISTAGVAGTPGSSLISTQVMLSTLGLGPTKILQAIKWVSIPDPFLDRMRTGANITGDAGASVIVDALEKRRQKKGHVTKQQHAQDVPPEGFEPPTNSLKG